MSDYTPNKNKSISSFEILPNEILFHIFNYLTSNEIIYSFFYSNERSQHLLLTQRYHFKLPTTNLNFWDEILPIIGSQIETLIIHIDHLTVSLDFFPNLTSIIISSPCCLLDGQLKSVLNHPCFQQLHTFKIKDVIRSNQSYDKNVLDDEQILFKTIFDSNNNLQLFEYLPSLAKLSYRNFNELNSNMNIRSLTLNLTEFQDVFTLIRYTPNLIYLNIQSEMPYKEAEQFHSRLINEIKLEEFYLKFKCRRFIGHPRFIPTTDLDQLFDVIHLFSSSLITLSLNFYDRYLMNLKNIIFNGINLENTLLKPLKKLQNFHFYAKLDDCKDAEQILSTFQNFPWSIGAHQNAYLYSLPFPFHELNHFRDFQDVRSNREELLQHHPQLWSKVTSLELVAIDQLDFRNLFSSIKLNMSKLSSIAFHNNKHYNSDDSCDEIERIDVELKSVTTICMQEVSINNIQQILMYSFPNVQCLILDHARLPSKENELTSFLGRNIQRMESDEFSLKKKDISYLLNLKSFKLTCGLQNQPLIVSHILTDLPKLEMLSIYAVPCGGCSVYGPESIFHSILNELDEDEIVAQYEIKYSGQYMRFIREAESSF